MTGTRSIALVATLLALAVLSRAGVAQTQAANDGPLRGAVEHCLSQAINARPTQIRKEHDSGTGHVSLALACGNEEGKALYDAIRPYAVERGPESNYMNQTVIFRFFGEAQCVRWVADAQGESMEDYWCFINLDLGERAQAAM